MTLNANISCPHLKRMLVFLQHQSQHQRPLSFLLLALSKAERPYSQVRKEVCLVLIVQGWSTVYEKFQLGKQIVMDYFKQRIIATICLRICR